MPADTTTDVLTAGDPEVGRIVAAETERQHQTLCLIASENHVSPAVLAASGSVLTNKYSEGYSGARYYEGNQQIDEIETLAVERATSLFGADHANVQPYSGSPANLAVYAALLSPGDKVLGLGLPAGGHLTHGHKVSVTGKWFQAFHYNVRRDDGRVDMDEVRELAMRERPKMLICGGTAVPRTIDFAAFAEIARESGAVLVADIAHIAGLIAGGAHPSPVGHAEVITTTTHKTLRGPRGAMILCDEQHAKPIDRAIFPGLQGGPHDHTTAAIAVALGEAATPEFSEYAHGIVRNARALGEGLSERGFDLVSGGTDNHLLLVDLRPKEIGGGTASEALDRAGIVCNRNAVPFDERPPRDPSGIRIGTPALTTRGMDVGEMATLAGWIDEVVTAAGREDEETIERVRGEVLELAEAFPLPA